MATGRVVVDPVAELEELLEAAKREASADR